MWAAKQFRHYLWGRKFHLLTDHRPLVWLTNLKEPNSKIQRWKILLSEYDFDIKHVEGKENKVADALSRVKINSEINVFECGQCNKSYEKAQKLKQHVENIHEKIKFPCPKCKTPFSAKHTMIKHSEKCKPTNYPISNKPFKTKKLFDKHSKIMHKKNIIPKKKMLENATIHSGIEDNGDLIPISEKPLNYFKHKILVLTNTEIEENIKGHTFKKPNYNDKDLSEFTKK